MQKYLGSMEGAVLSGKLAAAVISKDHPAAQLNPNKTQFTWAPMSDFLIVRYKK